MSTSPPELPDTDDPWTLLDVPRGASPPEIRRAYLRMIKIYKPDRHPEAFRRIREAFDALWVDDRDRPAGGVPGWNDEDRGPADSIEEGWGHTAPSNEPPASTPAPPVVVTKPEPRRRSSDRAQIDGLLQALRAAMAADDREEAVRLLLEPEHAPLANDTRVADAVVRVACSVVLSRPERFDELSAAYHDVLLDRSLEHHGGILMQMRGAAPQWDAWTRATADLPELSRFVELSSALEDAQLQALGREVVERAEADPTRWLARLDRAQRDAPAVLELYVHAAGEWSDRFVPSPEPDATTRATIVDGLEGLLLRNEVLSKARLRRTLLSAAAILAVLWMAPAHPLVMGAAALVLVSLVHALAFDPTTRIYREALRPAVAAWAWQGHDLQHAVIALRELVERQSFGRRMLEPDTPSRYPELLAADEALRAHAATGRMRAER